MARIFLRTISGCRRDARINLCGHSICFFLCSRHQMRPDLYKNRRAQTSVVPPGPFKVAILNPRPPLPPPSFNSFAANAYTTSERCRGADTAARRGPADAADEAHCAGAVGDQKHAFQDGDWAGSSPPGGHHGALSHNCIAATCLRR